MIVLAFNGAARAVRMTPVRARHKAPPAGIVVQRHWAVGTNEHHAAGHQYAVGRARRARRNLDPDGFPIGLAFRGGDVAGFRYECAKLRIGHVMLVHPKAMHLRPVRRALIGLGELVVATHHEGATPNPCHVARTRCTVTDGHRRRSSTRRRHCLARHGTRPGDGEANCNRYGDRVAIHAPAGLRHLPFMEIFMASVLIVARLWPAKPVCHGA